MLSPLASQRGICPEPYQGEGEAPYSPYPPPLTPTLYAQPCRYQEPMPYTITDSDEYGVNHAVLTFDSPQHARDYLRGLLSATDNTAMELALQAELEEVEMSCDTSETSEAPSRGF